MRNLAIRCEPLLEFRGHCSGMFRCFIVSSASSAPSLACSTLRLRSGPRYAITALIATSSAGLALLLTAHKGLVTSSVMTRQPTNATNVAATRIARAAISSSCLADTAAEVAADLQTSAVPHVVASSVSLVGVDRARAWALKLRGRIGTASAETRSSEPAGVIAGA